MTTRIVLEDVYIEADAGTGRILAVKPSDADGNPVSRDHSDDPPYWSQLEHQFPGMVRSQFVGPSYYGHTEYFVVYENLPEGAIRS